MIIALRVILSFIVAIVFIGIGISTFFSSPNYLSIPDLSLGSVVDDVEGISYVNLGEFSGLYSDTGELSGEVTVSDGINNINANIPGKYITFFKDTDISNAFSGTGFFIEQEGVGEVFVDTLTTPGKVFVYSFNTPVTISLLSDDKQEEYVDIFLTPHMYLEFQASRGKYLKNADRIRIGTVFKLGYLGSLGSYSQEEEYIRKYFESDDLFFTKVTSIIQTQDLKLQTELEDFSQQSVSQIPGKESIQRYVNLFVNDEKKKVFYKNKVLEGYIEILFIEDFEDGKKHLLQVQKDLDLLKELDKESYDELISLKNSILQGLNSSYGEDLIIPKLVFTSFGKNTFVEEKWYFAFFSFGLFSSYDKSGIFSDQLSGKFLQYFPLYIDTLSLPDEEISKRYDYFLYYLEEQLLYLLNTNDNSKNIGFIIETFQNYIDISILNSEYSEIDRVSRLFVFAEILENIDIFLRLEYFASERTQEGILTYHDENKISAQDVSNLNNNIEQLYKIYDSDKKYLDANSSRDNEIMKNILTSRENILEYFSALENYEVYKSIYDISKTNLLNLGTFSTGEDSELSLEKAREYLSQFIGLSFLGADITIENNSYYHIENINVSGKVFMFDLYPGPEYKITNIFIDNVAKPIQYKLGNIQQDWGEIYKTAPIEQRDQYDFSRFFILTFFDQINSNVEEYVIDTQAEQEDKTEVVFKKDILLGNPGEFTVLESFLDIEYEDISLEKQNLDYNIFLNDVEFTISLDKEVGGSTTYKGILSSQYILNNLDHYFTDLSLQVYRRYDDPTKQLLFSEENILIGGNIHISDLEELIEKIMTQVSFYSSVYSEISSITTVGNIILQYTSFNDKLSIKFDSLGEKYTILLQDGTIESVYKGVLKITSGDISLGEIQNYIK